MKEKTVYVAFDGKEFSNAFECNLYEISTDSNNSFIYSLIKKVRFFSGYVEQINTSELSEKAEGVKYIYFDGLSLNEKQWLSSRLDELYDFYIDIDDNSLYVKDDRNGWFYSLEKLEYCFQNKIKSYEADEKRIEKTIAKENF